MGEMVADIGEFIVCYECTIKEEPKPIINVDIWEVTCYECTMRSYNL